METQVNQFTQTFMIMLGDDDCCPGEQSLASNVFVELFDDLRCPLAHFLAYFRFWANVKHTQLAISTVEHVEGGWDYAQII